MDSQRLIPKTIPQLCPVSPEAYVFVNIDILIS